MKNIAKLFVLLFVSYISFSCMITGVTGSKHVTTESRNIAQDFTGIKVSQGIRVALTQDQNKSIIIEMDDNLHKLLVTEVEDGILHIYFSENVGKRKSSTLYIAAPSIHSIQSSSGADVKSINTIHTSDLSLEASSGSSINLRTEAQNIRIKSSSGSQITVAGLTDTLITDSSSGSDIITKKLSANTATAKASSGSQISLLATDKFSGKASSGASINCIGNPKEIESSKSSGGSIKIN